MAPAHHRKFQERQKAIEKQRIEILAKKQADFELSQQRALEQKERYTTDIIKWGLWQSRQEIERRLSKLTKSKQLQALKAQLRFRKHACSTAKAS